MRAYVLMCARSMVQSPTVRFGTRIRMHRAGCQEELGTVIGSHLRLFWLYRIGFQDEMKIQPSFQEGRGQTLIYCDVRIGCRNEETLEADNQFGHGAHTSFNSFFIPSPWATSRAVCSSWPANQGLIKSARPTQLVQRQRPTP